MSTRTAGRPVEVDVEGLARVAVSLFAERGFAAVTMDEIAVACGVSRRTLFRYYPSKSDLVWGGFREFTEPLLDRLRTAAPAQDPAAVLRSTYLAAATFPAETHQVTRQRLLLIDEHPRLYADGQPALLGIRDVFARFLDQDAADGAPNLSAQVAAAAMLAAGYTGFVWWARHPGEDLQEILRRTLLQVTPGS
jgi:AcrR family transcriptional regulator